MLRIYVVGVVLLALAGCGGEERDDSQPIAAWHVEGLTVDCGTAARSDNVRESDGVLVSTCCVWPRAIYEGERDRTVIMCCYRAEGPDGSWGWAETVDVLPADR